MRNLTILTLLLIISSILLTSSLIAIGRAATIKATSKPIAIIGMDDPQEDWLEDITVELAELHISKDMPVVLGVIPYQLDKPGGSLKEHLINFQKSNPDTVEIAQHGYDHSNELWGKSYDEQKQIVDRGLEIFLSLGIEPRTYVPPFGSADNTTIKVLSDMGFHTLLNPLEDLQSDELTVVAPLGVPLCRDRGLGSSCEFKSADELIEEIDRRLRAENKTVASIYYHMQDVSTENNAMNYTKYNQLSLLLDELKSSNKYQFMTAEGYHMFLTKSGSSGLSTSSSSSIAFYLITVMITVLVITATALVILFVFGLKKLSRIKLIAKDKSSMSDTSSVVGAIKDNSANVKVPEATEKTSQRNNPFLEQKKNED